MSPSLGTKIIIQDVQGHILRFIIKQIYRWSDVVSPLSGRIECPRFPSSMATYGYVLQQGIQMFLLQIS